MSNLGINTNDTEVQSYIASFYKHDETAKKLLSILSITDSFTKDAVIYFAINALNCSAVESENFFTKISLLPFVGERGEGTFQFYDIAKKYFSNLAESYFDIYDAHSLHSKYYNKISSELYPFLTDKEGSPAYNAILLSYAYHLSFCEPNAAIRVLDDYIGSPERITYKYKDYRAATLVLNNKNKFSNWRSLYNYYIGRFFFNVGDFDDCISKMKTVARPSHETSHTAYAYYFLATCRYRSQSTQSLKRALEYLDKSILMNHKGDPRGASIALTSSSRFLLLMTRLNSYNKSEILQKSLDKAEQSLDIKRTINDVYGIGISLQTLGRVYTKLSRSMEAQQCFRESIDIFKDCDDELAESISYKLLGIYYRDIKDYSEAEKYLQKALNIFTKHISSGVASTATENISFIPTTQNSLAVVAYKLKERSKALKLLETNLEKYRDHERDHIGCAMDHYKLGIYYMIDKQFDVSLEHLQHALVHNEEINNHSFMKKISNLIECVKDKLIPNQV